MIISSTKFTLRLTSITLSFSGFRTFTVGRFNDGSIQSLKLTFLITELTKFNGNPRSFFPELKPILIMDYRSTFDTAADGIFSPITKKALYIVVVFKPMVKSK